MARPLRVQFPGALYHVTARDNERKPIFRDERDRPAQVRKDLSRWHARRDAQISVRPSHVVACCVMETDVVELFKQACQLPEKDRAELAGLLLESLETEPDPGVEQAWAKEIERRVAELDSGAVKTVPWETVKAKLLGRLRES